jgi:hypothetical protein
MRETRSSVLASVEQWNPTAEQQREILARLSALNAQLLVTSTAGTQLIEPGNSAVVITAPEALSHRDGLELCVVNEDGTTHLYEHIASAAPEEALLHALERLPTA